MAASNEFAAFVNKANSKGTAFAMGNASWAAAADRNHTNGIYGHFAHVVGAAADARELGTLELPADDLPDVLAKSVLSQYFKKIDANTQANTIQPPVFNVASSRAAPKTYATTALLAQHNNTNWALAVPDALFIDPVAGASSASAAA